MLLEPGTNRSTGQRRVSCGGWSDHGARMNLGPNLRTKNKKGKAYQNRERHNAVLRPLLSRGDVSQFESAYEELWEMYAAVPQACGKCTPIGSQAHPDSHGRGGGKGSADLEQGGLVSRDKFPGRPGGSKRTAAYFRLRAALAMRGETFSACSCWCLR
jgi:hypothetical protein